MSQEDTKQESVIMNDVLIKLLIFCKKNNKINDAITNGPSEISSIVNNTIFRDQQSMTSCLYKLGEHKNWHAGGELQKLILEKFDDSLVRVISDIYQTGYFTKKQYDSTLKTYGIDPDDERIFDDDGFDQYGYDEEGYNKKGEHYND